MEYEVDFKEKLETLVAEARQEAIYMAMLLTKFNSEMDHILEITEECKDDQLALAAIYGTIEPDLRAMIDQTRKVRKGIKI